MSKVKARIVINKETGEYKTEIIEHLDGASCGDSVDKKIVNNLLNLNIEGFGDISEADDEGHTCEYFEQQQKGKHYEAKNIGKKSKDKKKEKLTLGFGV